MSVPVLSTDDPPAPSAGDQATDSQPAVTLRNRRFTKRRVIAGVAMLCVIGRGAATWETTRGGSAAAASPFTVTNENVKVTTGTMTQSVSASGTLEPTDDSDLSFAVSGTVTAVNVTTGQKVVEGQTLATIDSTALSDDEAADQATLTSDEDRLTTDTDDDAAASTIDSDETQVTSAQSQLSTADTDLTDATLKATFSGTVASVDLTVGEIVSGSGGSGGSGASGNANPTSTASDSTSTSDGVTVISTNSFTLSTTVDDTEVSEVKAGDRVDITPSGATTPITGTVASVSLIASSSSSSSVAAFPVVIDVTGTPSGIYPGDSATASIMVKQIDNAVEVPTAAISYRNSQATVTEAVGGSHQSVAVTTGASLNGETQITGGLSAGATIVEQVTKFNATGATSRSLFGNTSTGRGGGTGANGGFSPGGGFSGGPPSGGVGGPGGGN